ncbi:methylmalonyl-CoA epimerase [Aureimonas pseudogalii]|uniref:methylmalonyl-CoA epimerase n=1 Tax=Aureimonas pseudogalii TaxID=1744844 RepID=A0A7W6H4D6_9HYPH|nr:methylmalonyl-CoA epimerase [Aureimonas pseudogalii]MBB3998058.1 methylmalonyl-CoA/ethylmalonyl-CoA epimerase [Aureimonas pseudogalii]
MIGCLNHVAIAVPDLTRGIAFYRDILGATVSGVQPLPEHGVSVAFVLLDNSRIELVTPLGEASPLADFLLRQPTGGLHHVCYEVDDLDAALVQLVERGIRILGDGRPKTGAHGLPVVFLHPKDCGGTLIEIEERARPAAEV